MKTHRLLIPACIAVALAIGACREQGPTPPQERDTTLAARTVVGRDVAGWLGSWLSVRETSAERA